MHSFLRACDHHEHHQQERRSRSEQTAGWNRCSSQQQPQGATPAVEAELPLLSDAAAAEHSCQLERCQRVVINVSGELFETQLKTLNRYPDTLLGNEAKRRSYWDASRHQYFFDRHRPSFAAILNFYQTGGRLRRPQEVPEEIFYEELRYFQLDLAVIREFLLSEGYARRKVNTVVGTDWWCRLYATFEHPDSSMMARAVAAFSVLVIVLSIVLFCLETIPDHALPVRCPLSIGRYYQLMMLQEAGMTTSPAPTAMTTALVPVARVRYPWRSWIFILEALCVTWFCIEFAIRLLTYPYPRKRLLFSPTNWLDIASILPFILSAVILNSGSNCYGQQCSRKAYLLKSFGFLRVLRVLKFHKYVTGMQILGRTLRMSFREMTMFVFFMSVCIVLFSTAIYFAETGNERLQFGSIPDSFWWAVISMCTVGYGDYVPRSLPGKLVGGICVVAGVMTIALPVPVIVTNFNTVYRQTVHRKVRPEVVEERLIGHAAT